MEMLFVGGPKDGMRMDVEPAIRMRFADPGGLWGPFLVYHLERVQASGEAFSVYVHEGLGPAGLIRALIQRYPCPAPDA
jgi:hypothetical protein